MGLEILAKHGVCCAIHISYPRYSDKLDPALLGFSMTDPAARAVFKAPSIKLLADSTKTFEKIEATMRRAFDEKTLPLGNGVRLRFCPATGLAPLLDTIHKYEDEFSTVARQFIANFPATVEAVKTQWRATLDQQTGFSEEIRTKLLQQVVNKLPIKPPSLDSFSLTSAFLELKTPETPGLTDLDSATTAAAAEAWQRMKTKAEDDARRFGSDFVSTCRYELMSRLREFFAGMNNLVVSGKPINKRTIKRVQDFLATMQTLNFANDADIRNLTESLRASFGPDFSADSSIHNNSTIDGVKACIETSLKQLSIELDTESTDNGSSRIMQILGSTGKEESEQSLDIVI